MNEQPPNGHANGFLHRRDTDASQRANSEGLSKIISKDIPGMNKPVDESTTAYTEEKATGAVKLTLNTPGRVPTTPALGNIAGDSKLEICA